MGRKKKDNPQQQTMVEVKTTTAPCVPAIREKVKAWAAGGYKGTTETTRRLLNHWFHTDHRLPNGRKFQYHESQQKAVETLVYLFEVAKVRRQKSLLETFWLGFLVRVSSRLLESQSAVGSWSCGAKARMSAAGAGVGRGWEALNLGRVSADEA